MSRAMSAFSAAVFAVSAFGLTPTNAAAATPIPALDHVFMIVMENHSYPEIIGSGAAPYVNSLLTQSSVAANYVAVAHPSLPNYLALSGGSTFNINSDCTTCWISAANLGDSLESAGKSWKGYMESMPSACFVGDSYPYAQKHDPFIYYNNIRTNTSRCQSHVVPYTQLATDLKSTSTTPSFGWITPNMCNDMHDCSVAQGDVWLEQQVTSILSSPAFKTQRSLLAITWDEDDGSASNQVPTLLLGSGVKTNYASTTGYNHYSLMRTIESA
ncbi:MAG: phosphoesterase, partial [Chloroflexi bacterium]